MPSETSNYDIKPNFLDKVERVIQNLIFHFLIQKVLL